MIIVWDVVVIVVGALAAGAVVFFVFGLPLWFWRIPAGVRRRLAERSVVHVMQAQYLAAATDGQTSVVLQRRRTWFPSLLGRRLVFVYAGPPRRRALEFNHSRKLRTELVWLSVAISPDAAQAWLEGARAWYRPLDRALAVDRDYAGPGVVTGPASLLALDSTSDGSGT